MKRFILIIGIMLGLVAVPLAASASVTHEPPYSYTAVMNAPGHDLVTFHGSQCRGATSWVRILIQSTSGLLVSPYGASHGDHYSFSAYLRHPGHYTIYGITMACADGSWGAYGGPDAVHPVIWVR